MCKCRLCLGSAFCGSAVRCWVCLVLRAPLDAQQALTLKEAIAIAQEQSHQAEAARAGREAARYRDRAFYSRQLPQLTVAGTLPGYNRAIIPVLQPDGTTLFRPQDQNNANLTATMSQTVPLTGGDFFVSSSLAWLSVTGEDSFRTWNSTPVSIGIRQPLLRPNVAGWDRREQPVRYEVSERAFREAQGGHRAPHRRPLLRRARGPGPAGERRHQRLGERHALPAQPGSLQRRAHRRERPAAERAGAAPRPHLARRGAARAPEGGRRAQARPQPERRRDIDIVPPETAPDVQADTTRAVQEALRNRAIITDAELQELQARPPRERGQAQQRDRRDADRELRPERHRRRGEPRLPEPPGGAAVRVGSADPAGAVGRAEGRDPGGRSSTRSGSPAPPR